MIKNEKLRKAGKIIGDVVMYLFLALCVVTVVLTVYAKIDAKRTGSDAPSILGHQVRKVITASMEENDAVDVSDYKIKDIPKDSMILIEEVPSDPAEADQWYSELKVGDVLTFKYAYDDQVTITHRITSIEKNEAGGYTIYLMGDNESNALQIIETQNAATSPNYVIGRVVAVSVFMGFMQEPVAMVLIIILPCAVILVWEVIKIIRVLTADKKAKTEEARLKREQEQLLKDQELEELRRKLAELESQKKNNEEGDSE